jgi:hypothetical protein
MRPVNVLLSTEDSYLARELARQAVKAEVPLTLASHETLDDASVGAVIWDMDQRAVSAAMSARLERFSDRPLIVVASAGCRDIHAFCTQHGAAHLELRPVSPTLMVRVRGLLREAGRVASPDAPPVLERRSGPEVASLPSPWTFQPISTERR